MSKLAERPSVNLGAVMQARGLSQRGLSALVWGDDSYRKRVSNILAGHWPGPDIAQELAAGLGLDPSFLYLGPA